MLGQREGCPCSADLQSRAAAITPSGMTVNGDNKGSGAANTADRRLRLAAELRRNLMRRKDRLRPSGSFPQEAEQRTTTPGLVADLNT